MGRYTVKGTLIVSRNVAATVVVVVTFLWVFGLYQL